MKLFKKLFLKKASREAKRMGKQTHKNGKKISREFEKLVANLSEEIIGASQPLGNCHVKETVFSRFREVRREIKQTEHRIEEAENILAAEKDLLRNKKVEQDELKLFLEQEGVDTTTLSDADAFMRNEE